MARTAPVFDYTFDTPWLVTDTLETAMAAARAADEPVADALERAEVDELRSNPGYRERFHDLYRTAGVEVLSVTLGSRVDPSLPLDRRVAIDLARWQARFDAVGWLRKVTAPGGLRTIAESDDVGIILNTQNLGAAIDGDVEAVSTLFDAGVRIMQLTYNRQNLIGTGCTDYSDGGLSAHGHEVVERINDLEAILDLSHCNRLTTMDALEVTTAPAAFTHVSCAAVAGHDRAKSDAELAAVADIDGYVGIVAIPSFLAPTDNDPPFEVFFDHLAHAVETVGSERVGIGTDFLNLDVAVPEALLPEIRAGAEESLFRDEHRATAGLGTGFGPFRTYTDWGVIEAGVRERYDPDIADGILGGNFARFYEQVAG